MIIAVGRAERFSPNCVEKDKAILNSVGGVLMAKGYEVRAVAEEKPWPEEVAAAYITMGRSTNTLQRLEEMEQRGALVVNTPKSVRLCNTRWSLNRALEAAGVPLPEADGANGYWLKRGDGVAQTANDVRYAADKAERDMLMESMSNEGMSHIVVQAHVVGDLVKFYGVSGTPFFRTFYPGDDGQSKFGDECRNGRPMHYAFSLDRLHQAAELAAKTAGVDIYGGDCVVKKDGTFRVIDFNDWPSFSRCREDAAEAIAALVAEKLRQRS